MQLYFLPLLLHLMLFPCASSSSSSSIAVIVLGQWRSTSRDDMMSLKRNIGSGSEVDVIAHVEGEEAALHMREIFGKQLKVFVLKKCQEFDLSYLPTKGNSTHCSFDRYTCQFFRLPEVYMLLRGLESVRGRPYDVILRTRTDVLIESPVLALSGIKDSMAYGPAWQVPVVGSWHFDGVWAIRRGGKLVERAFIDLPASIFMLHERKKLAPFGRRDQVFDRENCDPEVLHQWIFSKELSNIERSDLCEFLPVISLRKYKLC